MLNYQTKCTTGHTGSLPSIASSHSLRSSSDSAWNVSGADLKTNETFIQQLLHIYTYHHFGVTINTMRGTLNWHNYTQWIIYKLCLLTNKCLHTPNHSRLCQPLSVVSGQPQLHLADIHQTVCAKHPQNNDGFPRLPLCCICIMECLTPFALNPVLTPTVLTLMLKMFCFDDIFGFAFITDFG